MSASRNDRAAGAILGMAAGDALGAGYEFQPPFDDGFVPHMKGGGPFGFEPGEWTDDTSMAVPILQALAEGMRLEDESTLDEIAAAWIDWARDAKDVGAQTRSVLSSATTGTAADLLRGAKAVHESHGRSGGNGSLMRTAPVALAYLGDEDGLVLAARAVSDLTHFEEDNGDACVLWSLAIRHAILSGELNLRRGLDRLPEHRRALWTERIGVAERSRPRDFAKNGWVVEALQAAWSAITTTPVSEELPARHLQLALEEAVRGGNDTDTVAAIAGGLLGARWGSSGIPARWKRTLHGWPGLTAHDLSRLAVLAVNGGGDDDQGWPSIASMYSPYPALVQHPHDGGVWLGGLGALENLPEEIDAVVSLCRTGAKQVTREHVEIWLIDKPDPMRNPNLDFVLTDAADTIAQLRSEGKRVFVHCFQGASRTPSVGALYAAKHRGIPVAQAVDEVARALPHGEPAQFLREAVTRLAVRRSGQRQ